MADGTEIEVGCPFHLGSGLFHLGNDFKSNGKPSIFVALVKNKTYCVFLFLMGFAFPSLLYSQVYSKARSITREDGLSDNRVTCFYKDKTGFVWIGTKNGLNRYDGHRITVFRPTAGNSISNEVINDIVEDSQGMIWVATMNGLNRYNPIKNHWENWLPLSAKVGDDLPSNLIWDLQVDHKNRVWIVSDVRELSYYDQTTKKFVYFDWPGFVKDNPRFQNGLYNSIRKIAFKNQNEIWIASNKALVLFNLSTKQFQYIAGNYRADVFDLRYDANASKVFWTIEKGKLLQWDEQNKTFTESVPVVESYPSTYFAFPDAKEIWMASANGFIRIDRTRRNISLSTHIPQLGGSLQPGSASAILQDGDGIHWVGTSNGVSVYDTKHAPAFFLPLLAVSDKESENSMGGVLYDEKNDRYFVCATQASAVFIIYKKTGEIKKITADVKGRPFLHCNAVKADNENKIWLLTDDKVLRYNESLDAFEEFLTPNKDEAVVFRDMTQDAEGNYWFGSFHKGLYYYSVKDKKFITQKGEGFENILTVTALHSDRPRNAVWIGTFSIGFYCYDLATKKLIAFMETPQHPEYGALDLVQDITQDAKGAIWAATHAGGLFRFTGNSSKGFQIAQFNMRSGLDENSFASLAAGNDSLLWALSGRGVLTLNTRGQVKGRMASDKTFHFSSYSSDERFPHKMIYHPQQQELLVAVGGGLLIHSTRQSYPNFQVPLVLTNVYLNNQPLAAERVAKANDQIFSFQENNLRFDIAKLYYGSADVVVQYRLKGWDREWQTSSQELSASYQNLSPGNYQFEARAVDANGKVLGTVHSFAIEIKPPFWQRWWAIVLMALLLATAIYFLLKRRINTIKRKAAIRQQLTELEGKALRAQMNPHFIFNSLNAIQELIVTQNIDAAYDYLSKFSKLLRLVLNNSEKSTILLADELHMLRLYLELESLRFRNSFSYNIVVDAAVDPDSLAVPPLLLQPFIENALWHGLMLKDGEKKLHLLIGQHDGKLECIVEDNGIGRRKAAEIKAQKIGATHFESRGLALSQQRISLLGSTGGNGSVKIDDLYEDGQPTGTKVSIYLPLIHV